MTFDTKFFLLLYIGAGIGFGAGMFKNFDGNFWYKLKASILVGLLWPIALLDF